MDMVTTTSLDGEVAVFPNWARYSPSHLLPYRYKPLGRCAAILAMTAGAHTRRTAPGGPAGLAGTTMLPANSR
jgi:hypothetical protein